MATTEYGCITEPMSILRTMLSYCPAFQEWVEETDGDIPASGSSRAAFCEDYIHYGYYQKPSGAAYVYPAAVINVPENVGFEMIAEGDGAVFNQGTGMLNLFIARAVPAALYTSAEAAFIDFAGVDTDGTKTGIGAIMADFRELADTVPQFQQFDVYLVDGPAFYSEEKQAGVGQRVIAAELRIRWGIS